MSTIRTRAPRSANAAPRLMAVVVLPTPPFWFARAMTRAVAGRRADAGAAMRSVTKPSTPQDATNPACHGTGPGPRAWEYAPGERHDGVRSAPRRVKPA